MIEALLILALGVKGPEFDEDPPKYKPLETIEKVGRESTAPCVRGLAIPGIGDEWDEYNIVFHPWERGPAYRDRNRLRGRAAPTLSMGACDSNAECEKATNELCEKHGGVDKDSVEITPHVNDDGKTCSGNCKQNGAVAFVDCKPNTIIDEPDPVH